MSDASHESLVYDWNDVGEPFDLKGRKPELDDETLRDGLQSPSVKDPSMEDKLKILHLIDRLGIDSADIGLPGAGPHVVESVTRLAQEIVDQKMQLEANCAARTLRVDIEPIARISQKTGLAIEVSCFLGSSPIRQFAEDWPLEKMLKHTEESVSFAVGENLPVMYVTEDTTRAHPDTLKALYSTAIACACAWIAGALRDRARPLALIGWLLGWGQWLAALLDAVENGALLTMLLDVPAQPWPAVARWCAVLKFALVLLGLIYTIVGVILVQYTARSTT